MKFEEVKKDCKFRTFHDNKCIHDKNPKKGLVDSCTFNNCPCKVELMKKKPGAAAK